VLQPYFATSAAEIEPLSAAELGRLGATDVRAVAGGVHFSTDRLGLYRVLLGARTIHRVLKPLREFAAITAEMLYSQTRRVPWEQYLTPEKTFAVFATFEKGKGPKGLTHSQFAALKIKDAIVDRLRREQGTRPNVDRHHPDLRVQAHFAGGRCTLSLEAAGASLHERGYRTAGGEAPLRETLAAALLDLAEWNGEQPLYDPFCGSGTIVLEAVLKARRFAPGLLRTEFAVQKWPDFEAADWSAAVAEARAQVRPEPPAWIGGSDSDPEAVRTAEQSAARVGLTATFHVARAELSSPPVNSPGVIVTNPPYGERLGSEEEVRKLYRAVAENWPRNFPGWRAFVLVGDLGLARDLSLPAVRKWKLFNGPLPCRLLQFDL
jgi:putative N6-adenine-specific DNA methylase